jgi:hypothetical protein
MNYTAEQQLGQGLRRRPLDLDDSDVDSSVMNKRDRFDDGGEDVGDEMMDV